MIDDKDIERLREIFITRKECGLTNEKMEKKLSDTKIELAVIQTQLKVILWILCGIGASVISMLVKMFFNV